MWQRIATLTLAVAYATIGLCQEVPTKRLDQALPEVLSKSKLLHAKLRRAPDVRTTQKILAEESVELRDWLGGQRWKFTSKVISVTETDGRYFLNLSTPSEIVGYSRNDAAFLDGGLFARQLYIRLAVGKEADFKTGDSVEVTGSVLALFGNDAPVRKPEEGSSVLLDLVIPPVNRQAPLRIELSLEKLSLNGDPSVVDMAMYVAAAAAPPTRVQPPIEAALLLIQTSVDKCITEARRQKNTALVSESLAASQVELSDSLDGLQWTFTVTAIDVDGGNGQYVLNTQCHTSLTKFAGNSGATRTGGVRAFSLQVPLDRTLAESIGRGDKVTITGTTSVQSDSYGLDRSTALPLFQVLLPPLDRKEPLGITVSLVNPTISK